jgi:hypothetical protein
MSQLIDVAGLSPEAVQTVETLVALLRQSGTGQVTPNAAQSMTPPTAAEIEERIRRLNAWSESHPVRKIEFDDSRETVYAERG